jgi:cytochrome P450
MLLATTCRLIAVKEQHNRHPAFGLGIHRCLGSNLA